MLRNPFGAPTVARLYLHMDAGAGGVVRQVVPVQVFGHDTVVEDLGRLTAGRPLVGVVVESDLPIYSQRVAYAATRRVVVRGKRRVVVSGERVSGRSNGVTAPMSLYHLRLPVGRPLLDLYNLGTRTARVVVSRSGTAPLRLTLPRDRSMRLDLSMPTKGLGHGSHGTSRGAMAIIVRSTAPLVVESEP